MDTEIRLHEHEERQVSLSPSQVATLRQTLSGKMEVRPTGEPDRYELKASSHVGFVILPGPLTLVIEPKLPIETLFALLAAVYDPQQDIFRDEAQDYATVQALFEFVVRIFVAHVEDLIARGILKSYRCLTDDPVALRGRLLFSETLHRRPVLRDRHWCTYSQFTPDVAENRILCWTAFQVRPYRYRETSLSGRLRRIELALSQVELDPEARRLFEQLSYHRLNDPYRPALALARLLLDHLTFSGTAGSEPFLAYLVDMNWLFERYVGAVLKRAAYHWDMQAVEQDPHYLDTGNHIRVIPDVVLYQWDNPLMVVDAKYKLDAKQGDLYQMVAYCHALGLTQAVLVHPAHESSPEGAISIRGPGDMRVRYLSLDLTGGPAELEAQGRRLAGEVENILEMERVEQDRLALAKRDHIPVLALHTAATQCANDNTS